MIDEDEEGFVHDGSARDPVSDYEAAPHGSPDDGDEAALEGHGGFRWQIIPVIMVVFMALLATILWRRVQQVDPVQRCADAYESSYTAIDTTLVDRMRVRAPDGNGRTSCGVLRLNGTVNTVPRRNVRQHRMPS